MIKAKKLLSILCSAAMVVSVFASTIANAASGATDEVALGLNYKLVSETDLVKVFDVYATGFNTLESWSTYVNIEGEVDKIASVVGSKNEAFSGDLAENFDSAAKTYIGGWFAPAGVATNGNILLNRITITLNAPLTQPLVLSTNDECEINDPDFSKSLGYTPWYSDGDWEANTLTFDVLKSESQKETVDATPVGTVFEGFNGVDTDRSVAAMVDTTITKATNKVTWKINVTPQAGKTYTGPTTKEVTFGNLESGSPMKVGLVVSYADADIANVEITGIEY